VHIYNLRNIGTIEDTVRSYFDQRLRYAAEALGKVTGEDAEELIASLNGQLEADEIAPDEIYKKALVEGTLNKQSKEEIRQAVERAQEAYQIATTSLFRDTSSYSFDSYQRELASPVDLKDLEEFTLKLLAKERRQVQRKDGFLEFLTPESLRSKDVPERFKMVTFDRPTAIRNAQAEFLAIGHPFVDAMLRHIGEYEFGGQTAIRAIRTPEALSGETLGGYQFNFTVRRRVAREDGDEYLFDMHTLVVNAEGEVIEGLSRIVASEYSCEYGDDSNGADVLKGLDLLSIEQAFEIAKTHLQEKTRLWDWDEDVDLIGVAKVVFLPATA